MSKSDPYYQFPLSGLAYGSTRMIRMDHIASFCVRDLGEKLGSDKSLSDLQLENSGLSQAAWPPGIETNVREHQYVLLGMQVLESVAGKHVQDILAQHKKVKMFCQEMEQRWGASPYVRLRADIFQQMSNCSVRGYRDFAALCGIYARLGASRYQRLTREQIMAAALGYKSPRIMPLHLREREDGASPMTTSAVRTTLDSLESRQLLVRCELSARRVLFSNRLSRDELLANCEQLIRREDMVKLNRSEERSIRTATKAASREAAQTPQAHTHTDRHYNRNNWCNGVNDHAGTAQGKPPESTSVSPRHRHDIATIIESFPIEPISRECRSNIIVANQPTMQRVEIMQDNVAEKLRRLIAQAKDIGTPESLRNAETYSKRLEQLDPQT